MLLVKLFSISILILCTVRTAHASKNQCEDVFSSDSIRGIKNKSQSNNEDTDFNKLESTLYVTYKPAPNREYNDAYLTYLYDPILREVTIKMIDTRAFENRSGIQTLLFKKLLEIHPHAESVKGTLSVTNKDVFFEFLGKSFGFDSLYEIGAYYKEFHAKNLPSYKFWYDFIEPLPDNTKQALIENAVKLTPAYKTRKRFGFDNAAPNDKLIEIVVENFDPELGAPKRMHFILKTYKNRIK